MKFINLTEVNNLKDVNYAELQDKEMDLEIIVKVSELIGDEIVEKIKENELSDEYILDVEGKYMFYKKETDKWIAIDTFCMNVEDKIVECESHGIAYDWLLDKIDKKELEELNKQQIKREEENKLITEEYKQGIMPKYFDIKEKNVNGSLINLNFKYEIIDDFVEKDDGTLNARFYWDYCEKFLKLCGCENIDMDEIMCRDDYRIMIDIHLNINTQKDEGVLSVMFDDEYIDIEVERALREKGITIPKIDRQFILKKKTEIGDNAIFEVTAIDFH